MRNVTKNSDQNGKEIFVSNYLESLPAQQLAASDHLATSEPMAYIRQKSGAGYLFRSEKDFFPDEY